MAQEEVRTAYAIEEMFKDAMRHARTVLESNKPFAYGRRYAAVWDGRWIMAMELGLPHVAHIAARGETLVRSACLYRAGLRCLITVPGLLGWEDPKTEAAQ